MDKRVVFAVAGSGKTKLIVDRLCLEKRSLIVTYTIDNTRNLEGRIRQKFGCIPPNIHLMTYFSFLHGFCFRPFLSYQMGTSNLCFEAPEYGKVTPTTTELSHYKTNNGLIYSNRIAKAIIKFRKVELVTDRLSKYFDELYIDEVQDLSANDFNLLIELCSAEIDILMVGDFYQHTYDTSKDGNIRKSLHKDYNSYAKSFKETGIDIDTTSLLKSHRCAPEVCQFVSDRLGIEIESHRTDSVAVNIVDSEQRANELVKDSNIIKLFYSDSKKYACYGKNWGKSKGEDGYQDVAIVLTAGAEKELKKNRRVTLPPSTLSKLYVACTRANGNLYLIPPKYLKSWKI